MDQSLLVFPSNGLLFLFRMKLLKYFLLSLQYSFRNLNLLWAYLRAPVIGFAAPDSMRLLQNFQPLRGVGYARIENVPLGAEDSRGSYEVCLFLQRDGAGGDAAGAEDTFDRIVKQAALIGCLRTLSFSCAYPC